MPSIPFSSSCSFFTSFIILFFYFYVFLISINRQDCVSSACWLFFLSFLGWEVDSAYWDEWERRHGSGGKGILSW